MTTKETRRQEWVAYIADYKASGLTMSAWCAANQFTLHQLKYWLRKLKDVSSTALQTDSARWVPLSVTDSSAVAASSTSLIVRIGKASIELRPGFDPRLLREAVHALGATC